LLKAQERLIERGAKEEEVIAVILDGERFPAKYGRTGFRRNFPFNGVWREKYYRTKQIEAYAVKNPVLSHGASSKEKAILTWGLCGGPTTSVGFKP
jgi:hypothetical protein